MTEIRDFSRVGKPLAGEQAAPFLKVMHTYFPDRSVLSMIDRGTWVRRIIQVFLDGDDIAYLKIDLVHEDENWLIPGEGESHERDVAQILSEHGLDVVPEILVVDTSCTLLPTPFVIQAHRGGTRLNALLEKVSRADAGEIYTTLGRFYRRVHNITNDQAGVWNGSTPDKPIGMPTSYMFEAEIVGGSGAKALEQGIISQHVYDRAVASWRDNMDVLCDFQPALVHYSPFVWNIYLDKPNGAWVVTKLVSLFDMMWWEPAYDLACLQFPPFADHNPTDWQHFVDGYGALPPRKRILLYTVLQTLCAMMGSYWELETDETRGWRSTGKQRLVSALDELDAIG